MSIHELPPDLQVLLAGGIWQTISSGASGALIFRIVRPDGPACYLKMAAPPLDEELLAEKQRLEWLQGRLPVPEIDAFYADSRRTCLLLSEIPGLEACDAAFAQDIPTVVRLLAQGLRLIHQLEIVACPFDQRLTQRMALAKRRVQAGVIDESDFDEQRKGMHADELFQVLLKRRPNIEEVVFTHGDYCLPNILLDPSATRVSGFVDWGRAGIADRYQDLALAARSLTHNFGQGWEPLFWEAYGLQTVDQARIEFYQLLDEFF